MNLRTYTMDGGRSKRRPKSSAAAVARQWSLLPTLLPFAIPLAILFAIVVIRVNKNSETEELYRKSNRFSQEIHDAKRDVQNMRNQIEHLKRRQFIYQQVARFQMPFRNPQPGQVRNLESGASSELRRAPAAAPRPLIITRR